MKGKELLRKKIVINGQITEQVHCISWQYDIRDMGIDNKISSLNKINKIVRRRFVKNISKNIKLTFKKLQKNPHYCLDLKYEPRKK
jgi:hypothetical protein